MRHARAGSCVTESSSPAAKVLLIRPMNEEIVDVTTEAAIELAPVEKTTPRVRKKRGRSIFLILLTLTTAVALTRTIGIANRLEQAEGVLQPLLDNSLYSQPADLESFIEKISKAIVEIVCGNSSGTGFASKIPDPSAGFSTHIVTNYHVIQDCIENPDDLSVTYNAEKRTPTKSSLYLYDEINDLALIEITAKLPTLVSSEYLAQPGWWTMAIGNPGTDDGTLFNATTFGQIVGVENQYWNYTSAIVNRGNSGGPLVNSLGEVIGINTEHRVGLVQGIWNLAVDTSLLCEEILKC